MGSMKAHNPFLTAGYAGPETFCDREAETSTLLDAIENGRNITLIAPRRLGKTGLIRHAFNRLERGGAIRTVYIDILAAQNLADFTRLFASAVFGSLDTSLEKAVAKVARLFRSCRPAISYDGVSGAPTLSVDFAPDRAEATLQEVFSYLARKDRPCVVAINEFQQASFFPEKGTEALLRSHVQSVPHVRFIFAGSREHLMRAMFLSSARPFYQSTQMLSIGPINRDAYREFAAGHFRKDGRTLDPEAFDWVYDTFDGVTWYVQATLNRMFARRGDAGDLVSARLAVGELVRENVYNFTRLLEEYPAGSVRLLRAVAREGHAAQPTSSAFLAEHTLRAPSSVAVSLRKLLDKEVVRRDERGYFVDDRLLALWLRDNP